MPGWHQVFRRQIVPELVPQIATYKQNQLKRTNKSFYVISFLKTGII